MRRVAVIDELAKEIRGAKSFNTDLLHGRRGTGVLVSWGRRCGMASSTQSF
jgi:hypothetical protein